MKNVRSEYLAGFRAGLPTGLGYLPVAFGFGILAVNLGLSLLAALGISASNLTSAGQVAGVRILAAGGSLVELALSTLVINLRYSLMAISLSQCLCPRYPVLHRLLTGFVITDEVFAVASTRGEEVTPAYMYGLGTLPVIGWTLGTLLGAAAGEILPGFLTSALGLAVYGMFIAIVLPPARRDRGVRLAVLLSAALSCLLAFLPGLREIPEGFAIILCTVIASAVFAWLRPIREVEE